MAPIKMDLVVVNRSGVDTSRQTYVYVEYNLETKENNLNACHLFNAAQN